MSLLNVMVTVATGGKQALRLVSEQRRKISLCERECSTSSWKSRSNHPRVGT
jgi:hypothetical protein